MSFVSGVRANLFLAEQAVNEGGTVNAAGIGFRFLEQQQNGQTLPFSVVALVDVSADSVGRKFPLALSLIHVASGQPVVFEGEDGAPQPVRIEQQVTADAPLATVGITPSEVEGRVTVVMAFEGGLPLDLGQQYAFVLEIDGRTTAGWTTGFHVVAPGQRSPAVGSLAPGIREYVVDVPRPARG